MGQTNSDESPHAMPSLTTRIVGLLRRLVFAGTSCRPIAKANRTIIALVNQKCRIKVASLPAKKCQASGNSSDGRYDSKELSVRLVFAATFSQAWKTQFAQCRAKAPGRSVQALVAASIPHVIIITGTTCSLEISAISHT